METIIEIIKYLFLGLVQGITEPIPISSSGHLIIVRELIGIEARGLSFEIFVNFASLIAVLLVYRQDIVRIAINSWLFLTKRSPENKNDFMFVIYLIIATIPVGVVGVLFGDVLGEALSGTNVVGVTLLITAVALWIIRDLQGSKSEGDLTVKDALVIGFAQTIAVTPGISRSGATIVGSMLMGLKKETALRFSFLLFIPVSLGTGLLEIPEIIQDPNIDSLWLPYLVAFVASLIATYFSLKWLIDVMKKGNLKYFSYYCVIVGLLVLLFL